MKTIKSFVLASLATFANAEKAPTGKCRALALSSGDENAAYQAGALKGIVGSKNFSPEDFAYDTVSGISGGALNAVILGNYTKG